MGPVLQSLFRLSETLGAPGLPAVVATTSSASLWIHTYSYEERNLTDICLESLAYLTVLVYSKTCLVTSLLSLQWCKHLHQYCVSVLDH